MFWSLSEKYKFMQSLFYFIDGKTNLPKSFEDCFSFNWHSLVPEEDKNPLRKVYNERYDEYSKNVDLVSFWGKARKTYNDHASESGCCVLSSEEYGAKMEETFNASHVCFYAIESYLLQDDDSEEDMEWYFKDGLKAVLGKIRTGSNT